MCTSPAGSRSDTSSSALHARETVWRCRAARTAPAWPRRRDAAGSGATSITGSHRFPRTAAAERVRLLLVRQVVVFHDQPCMFGQPRRASPMHGSRTSVAGAASARRSLACLARAIWPGEADTVSPAPRASADARAVDAEILAADQAARIDRQRRLAIAGGQDFGVDRVGKAHQPRVLQEARGAVAVAPGSSRVSRFGKRDPPSAAPAVRPASSRRPSAPRRPRRSGNARPGRPARHSASGGASASSSRPGRYRAARRSAWRGRNRRRSRGVFPAADRRSPPRLAAARR